MKCREKIQQAKRRRRKRKHTPPLNSDELEFAGVLIDDEPPSLAVVP